MKRIFVLFFLMIITSSLFCQSDIDMIKKVITDAYVNGIQNSGSVEEINSGFHPGFELLGIGQDGITITKLPIYTWIESVKRNKNEGRVPTIKIECNFLDIDITGYAAVAKIELHREGKLLFTDYLSLYKFKEGWRIVSKIYNRH